MLPLGIVQSMLNYHQVFTDFELKYQKTPYNEELLKKCPIITNQTYKPSPWFPFGKMQLYLGRYFDQKPPIEIYEKELVNIYREGQIALDWVKDTIGRKEQAKQAIVFIFPDLASISHTRHIRQFALDIHNEGYKTVVYHTRGVNGAKFVLPEPPLFHNMPEDVQEVMKQMKAKYSNYKLYGVGLSYGSNQLMNYLSGYKGKKGIQYFGDYKGCTKGVECLFDGATIAYAPVKIQEMHEQLEKNEKAVENVILHGYQHYIKKHCEQSFDTKVGKQIGMNFEKVMKANTISYLEKYFNRMIFGFDNMENYYKNETYTDRIKDIKIPLLCMYTQDDPIIPIKDIPKKEFLDNENVIYTEFKTGSHLCNYSGWKPKKWFKKPIIEFLNALYATPKEKSDLQYRKSHKRSVEI